MKWPPPDLYPARVGDLNDLWRGYVCARVEQMIDDSEEG